MYVRYVRNHFSWSNNFPFGGGITELVKNALSIYNRKVLFVTFLLISALPRSVFMVFHSARLIFMVFHGARLVFHGSRSVFMVFMFPGWFFIFYIENNLKLYSGPTVQFRPKHCFGAYLLFVTKNIVFAHIAKIATRPRSFGAKPPCQVILKTELAPNSSFHIHSFLHPRLRRQWYQSQLGKGTWSKVVLTSQRSLKGNMWVRPLQLLE